MRTGKLYPGGISAYGSWGHFKNLICVPGATYPNYQVNIYADGAELFDLGGAILVTGPLSKLLDLTAAGAGGLDFGPEQASTWYHMYIIGKTDGTISSIFSPLSGRGSGATISYTATGGVVTAVTANAVAGGAGYAVGDLVRIPGGDGKALATVATVGVYGAVVTFSTTPKYAGASGYTSATGQATTTAFTYPAGYTFSAYVGAIRNDAGSNIIGFYQSDNNVNVGGALSIGGGTSTGGSVIDVTVFVPSTAKRMWGHQYMLPGTTGSVSWYIGPDAATGVIRFMNYFSANGYSGGPWSIAINQTGSIWYQVQVAGMSLNILLGGWSY
jgi:hypothetical protein